MSLRAQNDGQHIAYIYNQTECKKHSAEQGTPCWSVLQPDTGRYLPALCGSRIKKAGFIGHVSSLSLNKKMAGGRNQKPRQYQ